MRHEIVGCSWKFKLQCPKRWEGLRETADSDVRLCESCLKEVFRCHTEEEVAARAQRGECVALGLFGADEQAGLLGEVVPNP